MYAGQSGEPVRDQALTPTGAADEPDENCPSSCQRARACLPEHPKRPAWRLR